MEIPCLIISGFLGSGKTTYLNSVLRKADGLRLGVLVNDFGDVPIDYDLIESADENILELTGGCVCCTYGGDLLSALTQMIARPDQFDALIIETSGLSLPGIVAASVKLVPGIGTVGVLGLVDGPGLATNIGDRFLSDTIVRQIKEANLILVTKVDQDDHAQKTQIQELLVRNSIQIDVAFDLPPKGLIERLFCGNCFSENPTTSLVSSIFLGRINPPKAAPTLVTSITVVLPETYDLETVLGELQSVNLPMIRAKGILRAGVGRYAIVNFAGTRWGVEYRPEPPTRPGMTFFLAVDSKQRQPITTQLLDVFNRSKTN